MSTPERKKLAYWLLVLVLLGTWFTERKRREAETNYLETILDPSSLGDGWHRIREQILIHGSTYEFRMIVPPPCEVLRSGERARYGAGNLLHFLPDTDTLNDGVRQ